MADQLRARLRAYQINRATARGQAAVASSLARLPGIMLISFVDAAALYQFGSYRTGAPTSFVLKNGTLEQRLDWFQTVWQRHRHDFSDECYLYIPFFYSIDADYVNIEMQRPDMIEIDLWAKVHIDRDGAWLPTLWERTHGQIILVNIQQTVRLALTDEDYLYRVDVAFPTKPDN